MVTAAALVVLLCSRTVLTMFRAYEAAVDLREGNGKLTLLEQIALG